MQNDLIGAIIDGFLQMQVVVVPGVHKRVFAGCLHVFAGLLDLAVGTHDDFDTVSINVALAERNWLRENIVASTE